MCPSGTTHSIQSVLTLHVATAGRRLQNSAWHIWEFLCFHTSALSLSPVPGLEWEATPWRISVRQTHMPPFTRAMCDLLMLWQCMCCTCRWPAWCVLPGVCSPFTDILTADSLGLSSLQHVLQGQKTMRQGSASKLSANLAFFSSPSTTPNLSSAQTAERDFLY